MAGADIDGGPELMIYLVTALLAEARPLVSHFGLERTSEVEPLNVFQRPELAVIASGVGRQAAAAAVDALAESIPQEEHSVWINIGVAGHRVYAVGTLVLAEMVLDPESGERWRLEPPSDPSAQVGTVQSVAHVETAFESDAVYDMEAAGFCERATRLTRPELIQVLKIVSDNRESGTLCVSARQVQRLLTISLPVIDRLISHLHRRARGLGADQSSDQRPKEKPDSVA